MKKQIIITIITFLTLYIAFSGCISPKYFIHAYIIQQTPEKYIELNEEQIENYPHLKEAIDTNTSIEIPYDEFKEIYDFLEEVNFNIKYQDSYYKVQFISQD